MRINRLYTDQPLQTGQQLSLDKSASHHLVNVLRLKNAESISLFNGDGHDYPATIVQADRKQTLVQLDPVRHYRPPPALPLHLAIGMSRGDRLDFAIQKATELGACEITPLLTARTTTRLDEARLNKKHLHLQKIVIAACEQSGRCDIPRLHPAQQFEPWLETPLQGTKLLLAPDANNTLETLAVPQQLVILSGPEGGLSDGEIDQARQHGYTACRLGPYVLRTETAPLAALAAAQALWGSFRS